jgi:hypothetical protein
MATDVLTTLPDTLDALDGWEVELVLDVGADALQLLPDQAAPFATAATAPAAAPQNLVQVAVWPTVQEASTPCVRLLAASLIGLGTLLAASALFARR